MSDCTMEFKKSFACGGVGFLVIFASGDRLLDAKVEWRGARPPFVEEIQWAKACFARWATNFGRCAMFIANWQAGSFETWVFLPDQPGRCLCRASGEPSLGDAVRFASTTLAAARECANSAQDRGHPERVKETRKL